MTELTKADFLEKCDKANVAVEFHSNNITISNIKDWNVNRDLQKYVVGSDNCYFISMEFSKMEIRIKCK